MPSHTKKERAKKQEPKKRKTGLQVRAEELRSAKRRLATFEEIGRRPFTTPRRFSALAVHDAIFIAKKAVKSAEKALERQRKVARDRAKAKQKPRRT